jgi:hypothetical protein
MKQGAGHEFRICQVGKTYQMFTLPVGSHSEFRTKVPGTPESLYMARQPEEIQKTAENCLHCLDLVHASIGVRWR